MTGKKPPTSSLLLNCDYQLLYASAQPIVHAWEFITYMHIDLGHSLLHVLVLQ